MVWALNNTWADPTNKPGQQRGMPAPGAEEQYTGAGPGHRGHFVPRQPFRPTKGLRSWLFPASPRGEQQGFPPPADVGQRRPFGSMPNVPPVYGQNIEVYTPYFSRGSAAYVQNYGKSLTNPIGAGIVALSRPRPSYGQSATYHNGAIWWTNQVIPTSINLAGLTDPQALADIVGSLNVEAMVRTTG